MQKKGAVEWLVEQINPYGVSVHNDLFEQAKEIENERLKEAYSMGRLGKSIKEFNETFKKQEVCKCGQPKVGEYSCQRTDCNQNL